MDIVTPITKGDWEVTELSGFDATEENMFFEATKESPIERHFYRINLRSGKTDKLTEKRRHTFMRFIARPAKRR